MLGSTSHQKRASSVLYAGRHSSEESPEAEGEQEQKERVEEEAEEGEGPARLTPESFQENWDDTGLNPPGLARVSLDITGDYSFSIR
jgi:hypothetical protein